jgi:diaminopimelate epimerase
MRIRFSKMQGAGNDFVVLDETRGPLGLGPAHYRRLADRHFGVGADQVLTVRPSPAPELDFEYLIHNADGAQVEQCGNGARCFVRFVREHGLSDKDRLRVKTLGGVIELRIAPDGLVTVDMGAPLFEPAQVPFDPQGLTPELVQGWRLWPLTLALAPPLASVRVAVLSMGNPHAVQRVEDIARAPVAEQGPLIERHRAFPRRVNAGFMQVLGRSQIALRVYERGVGETLACGSGACAAVVAGIRLGLLDASVDVQTRGGRLRIEWEGTPGADGPVPTVRMTGPAVTVFEGEIELPDPI